VHERGGDRQPLPLAAGQLLDLVTALVLQPDQLEHLVDPGLGDPVQRRDRGQLLARGEPLEEGRSLQLDADTHQQRRPAQSG
jgi:hypothetical protein